jgi:hypothetical protein
MYKVDYKFPIQILMFQKALQFKDDIILPYSTQNIVKISVKVPPFLTCHI